MHKRIELSHEVDVSADRPHCMLYKLSDIDNLRWGVWSRPPKYVREYLKSWAGP
jgi:hypothetical protein